MTEQEVLRELRIIRYRPTMSDIARQAGVHVSGVYKQMASGRLTKRYQTALAQVLRQYSDNERDQNSRSPLLQAPGGQRVEP